MAWTKGFNFRNTAVYVTDGTDETYVIGEQYPTTRNTVTFGWSSNTSVQSRNRNAANDRRLAGLNRDDADTPYFRVDLPATGQFVIRAAFGDNDNIKSITYNFQDTSTILATVIGTTLGAAHWLDAAGTDRTNATWPGSNTSITGTFATTQFRLQPNTFASEDPVAHLFLDQIDNVVNLVKLAGSRPSLVGYGGGLCG